MKMFDRKFGESLIQNLPMEPAVYLFKSDTGQVLYVGKAKNIRSRLRQYRNASRRKVHRKMQELVRESSKLEVRLKDTEQEALLAENALIRELKPPYNVDGSYTFLYPAIGLGGHSRQVLLGFSTNTDGWKDLNLQWYGVFRSRTQARSAFDSLIYLLGIAGHMERATHLPAHTRMQGSRLTGFRRIAPDVVNCLHRFLSGDDAEMLVPMITQLLEKPRARRDASVVQQHLRMLRSFHRSHLAPLRSALKAAGYGVPFIPQEDRDALFIATSQR